MASDVPAELKQADINLYKTATRAAQLKAVKPIIAYWCDYWVVNQILARQLHTGDAAIMQYTLTLMDRLEQIKTDYANEEAVTDDIAGQAYVEQFAQETLDRAERVIKADKVTANTAMTFDAALTFFNLVNIWGPPDGETVQKIKYAKWNAARIAKALRDGMDPNESNPKVEDMEEATTALDPSDPAVAALSTPFEPPGPKAATVEDVPDVALSHPPSHIIAAEDPEVSIPDAHSTETDDLTLPDAPDDVAQDGGELKLPSAPGYQTQPAADDGYFSPPPALPSPISPPSAPTPSAAPRNPPVAKSATPAVPRPAIPPPSVPVVHKAPAVAPAPVHIASAAPAVVASSGEVDEVAIARAQKHAKWAISALNFEDIPTAVRELRHALETLGAS